MEFLPQTITIDQSAWGDVLSIEVPGFVAVGTGLGYYIDEKPKEPAKFFTMNANGKEIEVYRNEDDTRYCPTHLATGKSLQYWFYTEEQCKQYIEEIAPLLDWILPLEEMLKLPAWSTIGVICKEIAERIIGAKIVR